MCTVCQVNKSRKNLQKSSFFQKSLSWQVCICEFVASAHCYPPYVCRRLRPQVPHQPFHPDNKEPPAARTGGLLNEISYQSANSCGLCLAIRSGYESPSAALNSYHLDVYLLGGKNWQTSSPALFKASFTLWFVAANGGTPAIKKKKKNGKITHLHVIDFWVAVIPFDLHWWNLVSNCY